MKITLHHIGQEIPTVETLCGTHAQAIHKLEQRSIALETLCGEMLATLKLNRQLGYITAADGGCDFDHIIDAWWKRFSDDYDYFKVHEVGRPLPINTEILLDDGRWVEACSWPQYDATKNYQARIKKGAK